MRAIRWENDHLSLLDQLLLPNEVKWIHCYTSLEVAEAIEKMQVRGAPAIGAAAAYGIVLASIEEGATLESIENACDRLAKTRPTAVNLFWAISRMRSKLSLEYQSLSELQQDFVNEANAIAALDIEVNRAIGRHGAELVPNSARIITHCNTGSLATVEYGTALGVIRSAHAQGKVLEVLVDETRPFLQGARLTAYELQEDQIPLRIITDSMAGHYMSQGLVDFAVVGADRVTANGDTANKIGTYSLAILAKYHGIPFYVAAPVSTFDRSLSTGKEIIIEERNSEEVLQIAGTRIAPLGALAGHPAFDVTPHELITGIITEYGVIHEPTQERVAAFFEEHLVLGGNR